MFKKLLIASAALAAAAGVHAQSSQSATINLQATISPGTCAVTLPGSTVADFGTIAGAAARSATLKPALLPANHHLDMSTKTFKWDVSCTAATPLQLVFTDSKTGNVPAYDGNEASRFGLVDSASTATTKPAIGSYTLSFVTSTTVVDGVKPMGYMQAVAGSTTWSTSTGANLTPGSAYGFQAASTTQTVPSVLTKASGDIQVNVLLLKSYVNAALKDIVIQGGGTITLQYL